MSEAPLYKFLPQSKGLCGGTMHSCASCLRLFGPTDLVSPTPKLTDLYREPSASTYYAVVTDTLPVGDFQPREKSFSPETNRFSSKRGRFVKDFVSWPQFWTPVQ